jgi:hypothetical protein
MILNRFRNAPRIVFATGMLVLALACFLRWRLHPTAYLSQDGLDGLLGFIFGLSIGINLMGLLLLRRMSRRA